MTMRKHRWHAAAVTALLLTGCGGPESDATTGEATPLTKDQVGRALPDGEAMTGWEQSFESMAIEMNELYRSQACPIKGNAGCGGARFFGASTFKRGEPFASVTFQIVAYDSEQAAQDAYRVLWDGYYGTRAGQKAEPLDLGPIGDERDARLGTSGIDGEPGAVTQMRVGTTLLWTMEAATRKGDIDADSVQDLATMLAQRSQQAQNGDEPSATLND
ncbi:hypothetical protein [Streptomyces sp. MJP52]|uniref:hypothetical protein n=1 Tax=Streptomyces sp. MJP52 TaxID=2940555 RepID=UPI002476EE9D|nr:hypothetical protein [Streptomyces sp. MJP52]MDH6228897.1 hypothetical protein [Streptomyces sp. MJP52]